MLATAKPTVNAAPGEQGTQAPRPANRRRLFLIAAVLALVVAAAFGAWARFFSPVKVAVSHPAANVAVQAFGLGTVEARVTSKVGFKVSGVLTDLRADVGDRVAKGTVLARLDDREQSARAARAKAATEQAEANLQRATANVQKAQANFANAKTINERRQKLVQSGDHPRSSRRSRQDRPGGRLRGRQPRHQRSAVARAAIGDAKAQLQQERPRWISTR